MSQYYNVVPWFNTKEWLSVYNKICAEPCTTTEKKEALYLLNIWKVRCPALPSGIESTLSLLDVHLGDLQSPIANNNQEVVLRLAYSSAIMRFVNHMLDTETAKGASLYYAAKNLDVPDWLIDLRHDAAHSNNLPSIQLLREAAEISFEWLRKNYWDKHKKHIQDYVIGNLSEDDGENSKLEALLNLCLSLSICAHSQCKIKNLADIADETLQETVVHNIKEFFGDSVDLSNLKTTSVVALISMLNTQSQSLLEGKHRSATVNRVLLGEDSLLLSLELVDELSQKEFYQNNTLSKSYIQCFEVLLTFLHTNDLILDFVLELISITQNDTKSEHLCKLAALWLSVILRALKRSQSFLEIYTLKTSEVSKKNKRKLFKKWLPHYNMANCSLLLDLSQSVPQELTNINYLQPIISSYNPYLAFFIKDMLNLAEPKLPKATVEQICSLADLISSPSKFTTSSNKLYTVEDLMMDGSDGNKEDSSDSDCVEVDDTNEIHIENRVSENNEWCIWSLASPNYDWSACPIGLLPWQITTMEVDQ